MNEKINEMKRLVEQLNQASEAYYNTGHPIMTDKEFDIKLDELKKLEEMSGIVFSNSPTQNVGAPVLDKLNKIKHEHKPMLSLEKVHSAEEIIKFAKGHELIAMIKLDGLSVRLTYENGKLVKGETRGNGIEGSLITEHIKQFKNVPLTIDKNGTYVVDGEAIITDEDFDFINATLPEGTEKFKNSRNLASGTLALLDTSLVKERRLSFVLWDVIVGSEHNNFQDKLNEAIDLGFECTPWTCVYTKDMNAEYITGINNVMFETSEELSYPNDGVVWKLKDIKYGETLGQTSHHFCNAVAFKKQNDEYETILTDVEWNTSKTGLINPVAVFRPVDIEGSTITKATLHNLSYMKDMRIAIGGTITVIKSNEVIPKVTSCIADHWDFKIPTKCPICDGKTEIRKDNNTEILVCTNEDCQGKLLGKLSHAVSKNALNIEGLSESTIEFLIEKKWMSSIRDLFRLKLVASEWSKESGFGKKSVMKLLDQIEEKRTTTVERFIYAQSIPLIGRTASKDIAKFCNGDIEKFCEIMSTGKAKQFTKIEGFGQVMYESLVSWMNKHWIEFLALKQEFNFIVETAHNKNNGVDLTGKTFVITGALNHYSNRDELSNLISSLNGKVSNSISKNTFALISNDKNSNSSKFKKASDLSINIWDEEQFIQYIRG